MQMIKDMVQEKKTVHTTDDYITALIKYEVEFNNWCCDAMYAV